MAENTSGNTGQDNALNVLAGVLDAERPGAATPPPGDKTTPPPPGDKGTPPPPGGDAKPPPETDLAKIINAAVEQANRPLLDKIKNLEAGDASRETQRHVEDVREDYLRGKMDDLPREIARKMMPATKDPALLAKAEQDLRGMFNAWYTQVHRKNATDFGGHKDGGTPVSQSPLTLVNDPRNAQQLLADALNKETR